MDSMMLELKPITPAVGAILGGVDLRAPLEPVVVQEIRQSVLDHGVIFFRNQDLSRDQMLSFMQNFGTPRLDPISSDRPVSVSDTVTEMHTLPTKRATSVWHYDSSLDAEPASIISLRAIELPPVGGDTCWASMYAAYDALSEPLRTMLDGLTAVHSAYQLYSLMPPQADIQQDMASVHPVIRVHPETGRKALFVDELWTQRIVELEPAESANLLAFLFDHVKSPNFTVRWCWNVNDIALWDNRAFQHYAVNDYDTTRVLQKTILAGDRPEGPS
jgi:alpha-ketoglutarate-dependent taurine dioxygenase